MEERIQGLIEKELSDKILKPDFNSKSGRELLAFYLQTKFKQILSFDSKHETPIIREVNPDFISNFSKRLVNSPDKRFLISITGESASGKSTICNNIVQVIKQFSMPVTILSTDNYFNDISELIKKYGTFDNLRDCGYDVDAPTSFQLNILKRDLKLLSEGKDIKCPSYLPNGTGISIPEAIDIKSSKIIIVEGTATMYENVKDIFDVKIYIETDNDIRKKWFMDRAVTERNQNEENALKHWNYIQIAGEKYVKPYRSDSDLILNGKSDLKYFRQILEYIYTITNNFQ